MADDDPGNIVTMYIRKTTRKHKDKTYTELSPFQIAATPQGPRQKVIGSLGDLKHRPKEEYLKPIRNVEATRNAV